MDKANTAVAAGGKAATYRELTPKETKTQVSTIIDGGTLSNFPVWLFDVDTTNTQPLTRPTFGFTLTGGKGIGGGLNKAVSRAPWAVSFGFDIFHTSQEAWDTRFVSHSTRVRSIAVDAGTIATTQFNLTTGGPGPADQQRSRGRERVPRQVHARRLREHVRTEVRRRVAGERQARREGARREGLD